MKHLNYQKGISPIIAVIILAIILVGGAYYFKQQAKPASKSVVADVTANWKTYSNKTLNYEVKYPSTASLANLSSDSLLWINLGLTYTALSQGTNGPWPFSISAGEVTNPSKKDFSAFFQDYAKTQGLYKNTSFVQDANITSYSAFRVNSLQNPSGAKILQVFIQAADKSRYIIFDLNFYDPQKPYENQDKALKLFDQILSTFRFTGQNQTSATPFCIPSQLLVQTNPQGAAGTMYVNTTIKNISNSACQIIGNNFLETHFDSTIKNVTTSHPKQPATEIFTLTPNQTLYSLFTYPNGPQCSSAPKQQAMTLSYTISSTDSIAFKNSDGTSLSIQDCTSPTEISNIQIWPLSDAPITP